MKLSNPYNTHAYKQTHGFIEQVQRCRFSARGLYVQSNSILEHCSHRSQMRWFSNETGCSVVAMLIANCLLRLIFSPLRFTSSEKAWFTHKHTYTLRARVSEREKLLAYAVFVVEHKLIKQSLQMFLENLPAQHVPIHIHIHARTQY